jgi:hypothetical protein
MNEMSRSPLPPEIFGNLRRPGVARAGQMCPRLRLSTGRLTDMNSLSRFQQTASGPILFVVDDDVSVCESVELTLRRGKPWSAAHRGKMIGKMGPTLFLSWYVWRPNSACRRRLARTTKSTVRRACAHFSGLARARAIRLMRWPVHEGMTRAPRINRFIPRSGRTRRWPYASIGSDS